MDIALFLVYCAFIATRTLIPLRSSLLPVYFFHNLTHTSFFGFVFPTWTDPQVDCEALRTAGIHHSEPCDDRAGEQVMVCSHFCVCVHLCLTCFLLVFSQFHFTVVPGIWRKTEGLPCPPVQIVSWVLVAVLEEWTSETTRPAWHK